MNPESPLEPGVNRENGWVWDWLPPAEVDVYIFLFFRLGENNILGFYFESILCIDRYFDYDRVFLLKPIVSLNLSNFGDENIILRLFFCRDLLLGKGLWRYINVEDTFADF